MLVTAYSAKRAQPFSDLQAYVRHCLLLHQGLEVCAEKGLKTKALLRAEGEGMSQEELGKHMGKIYKLYKSCRGAKRQAVLAVYDTWCRQMVRINLRGEAPKGSVRAVASTHNFAGADQDCGCAVFYFEDARGARLEGSQPFGFKGLHRSPLCFDRLKPDGKQSSDLGKLWEIDV